MRFIIVTMGTEGDIRPYIALARELRSYDHEISIATSRNHAKVVGDFGIDYIPITPYSGRSPSFFNFRFVAALKSSIVNNNGFLQELWNVCQQADVIIYNVATFPCFYIAEKLGIPSFGAFLQPHHPTTEFPDPSITVGKPLGGFFNLVGFWLFDILHWQYVRRSVNRFRKETLQLPELSARNTILRQLKERGSYIIYAYSPSFLPRPYDWRSDHLHVTGYWYLDTLKEDYSPPADLERFLQSGSAPVFISVMWNTHKFTKERIAEIGQLSGSRLLIHDLYGEMEGITSSERIFYIKGSVPHEWLFKKIVLAIHHGGLGICMNCIRAGAPMITIPADAGGNDHRFWAYQVSRSGVGIRLSVPDRQFIPGLVSAIKQITDNEDIRSHAVELSKKIKEENGLKDAIQFISARCRRQGYDLPVIP